MIIGTIIGASLIIYCIYKWAEAKHQLDWVLKEMGKDE